ncbi:MAG: VWA domain-containing protein [Thermodesulfobacteriota bacterium]
MERAVVRHELARRMGPQPPVSWVLDEPAGGLAALEPPELAAVLDQVPVIWPVSQGLTFAFLAEVPQALGCLTPRQLPDWVKGILDAYEGGGLAAARLFMAEVERRFLCRLRDRGGVAFPAVAGRLLPYLRSLAGRSIDLAPAPWAGTDVATIFLPAEIDLGADGAAHRLVYKLVASWQWLMLAEGSFWPALPDGSHQDLAAALASSSRPDLAAACYWLAEGRRLLARLGRRLPGLASDLAPLWPLLVTGRPAPALLAPGHGVVETLWRLGLGTAGEGPPELAARIGQAAGLLARLVKPAATSADSLAVAAGLGQLLADLPRGGLVPPPLLFLGEPDLAAVAAGRLRRRQEARQQFVEALGRLLTQELGVLPPPSPGPTVARPQGDAAVAVPAAAGGAPRDETKAREPELMIQVADREVRLSEGLRSLAREIATDLGALPAAYVQSALDMAGAGGVGREVAAPLAGEAATGPLTYDEWDYRRAGFRRNWCRLLEKELTPVQSDFVAETLTRRRGLLVHLRRQFEMLRADYRFVRRQTEGEEIDLDAVTEMLADQAAGQPPSEKLFIRQLRNERDIATCFLVDLSSSTEGWVGATIKEALVLLCEALERLGDRYAVYGYSGMRRLRSEIFHVKHLEEPYGDAVRQRIAALAPREYTRMGPPIRHATRLLAAADARVRLLIILSDGKPEDYDDYKGDYAIEDTRHALIEAKVRGIHPFGITIDRQARDYVAHLYGAVESIVLDDVAKLPARLPEIYRILTR